jgi:hypothetical protein
VPGRERRLRPRSNRLAGQFTAAGSKFDEADWTWREVGQIYEFPRSPAGSIQYGNIEGVGWITPTRIVTVSDRRKKSTQPDKSLAEKDQSIQIFDIPG